MNTQGVDVSEIDYFLYDQESEIYPKRLIDLATNVSDHHPIFIEITCKPNRSVIKTKNNKSKRINWDKVDKQSYSENVNEKINKLTEDIKKDNCNIENIIIEAMNILTNAAKQSSNGRSYGKNTAK